MLLVTLFFLISFNIAGAIKWFVLLRLGTIPRKLFFGTLCVEALLLLTCWMTLFQNIDLEIQQPRFPWAALSLWFVVSSALHWSLVAKTWGRSKRNGWLSLCWALGFVLLAPTVFASIFVVVMVKAATQ